MKKFLKQKHFFQFIEMVTLIMSALVYLMLNAQTSTASTLPCTQDAATCKSLQTCLNGQSSAAGELTCYNNLDPEDYSTASSQLQTTKVQSQQTTSQASSNNSTPCGDKCNLTYTPLEPLPNVDYSAITGAHGLSNLVNTIFTILIVVGALMAVLMLTIGGFQYMLSSSITTKQQGLKRTQAAVWGIVLIAAIWLILHTINPALLNVNLAP
jgi:hypothetical protein